MSEGLSTSRQCTASAGCLAAEGKRFVIRYYSRTTAMPEKRLRYDEAVALAKAGLNIGSVYQDRARETADFNLERGKLDGASAWKAAWEVGQPAGTTIFFAVDTDLGAADIRSFVIPYFKGVRKAFETTPGGDLSHRIGVYGSGLTCRLLTEAGLVERTWLAEATGWRESGTFTAWNVKQFVNQASLCALDANWERCQSRAAFGEWQPIGFEEDESAKNWRVVTANQLNLRAVPTATDNAPVATLNGGTRVLVLGRATGNWVRVRVMLQGATFRGYVNGTFLGTVRAPARAALLESMPEEALEAVQIPAVHLKENSPAATRASTSGLAFPIGESGRPTRRPRDPEAARVQQLTTIGDWLSVEKSARYLPRDGVTFCNVYAADYCYLSGVYLPRCWWTGAALTQLAAGRKVVPAYGSTVREMRADDLYQWLLDFGAQFGWVRVASVNDLQKAANAGGVGVICADNKTPGRPGHISVVVPETATQKAVRDKAGNVTQPLQSQAGAKNRRYGSAGTSWWQGSEFVGHVLFVHD